MMIYRAPWILLSSLLLLYTKQSTCEPRSTEAALICSNNTAPDSDRQIYITNFLNAMDSVTRQVYRQRYGAATVGTGLNNTVYTFAECMKDLSWNDCHLCLAQCKTKILRCRPVYKLTKGGRIFCDGCYLRYDDYMFFDESLSSEDRTVCGGGDFVGDKDLFGGNVMALVRNVSVEGVKNGGFFTGLVSEGNLTVYGLGQCWEFVNGSGCVDCLENAVSRISSCRPKVEGRVLNAGCYVRYSLMRFYNDSENDATFINGGGGGFHRRATILALTCGAAAFLLFLATISFLARKKILRQRREKKRFGALLTIANKSKINFSYKTLEKATNYFADSNKLGQGGSGSVYKGTLAGGQIVAVKRLLFNTTQWANHFFNEVNLISGIDHKNLVKLLGCSITGPQSLLVYEYVANQSLHDHLFARKHVPVLGWAERYKIILGIAEGLAYLHNESNLRIIHRDIKLSNILLDEDFTPKIADFGLARLFPDDKTYISIAGTIGYMAPEYIFRGKLTEKADVYSFGILVIEVVCGTKNNTFAQSSYSMLQKVWELHETGKLSEAVDSSINGNFPEDEVNMLLQIGLTCVQANAELRPYMSIVVKMITGEHEICVPLQPPFLNSSSLEDSPSNHEYFFQYKASSGNEITESIVEPI